MNFLLVLTVIGVAQCSPFLKNLPANAVVTYEYDGHRLEGIEIDYNDDRRVYAVPAPVAPVPVAPAPAPVAAAAPVVTSYSAPAAPAPAAPVVTTYSAPAPVAAASVPTYYEVDDDGDFDVATHVVYRTPGASPVLYSLPAAPAPAAPAPVVYSHPAAPVPVYYSHPNVYYTYESDEDDK